MRSAAAAVLAGLALLVAGCSTAPAAEGGFVSGDGTITQVPVGERVEAPRIAGETLAGGRFDSDAVAGRVIVYNVWGSWCAPCRAEAPALVEAAEATADRAVFVGINIRDLDPAPARAFVRAFEVPYDNVYDPDGELLLRFAGQLPPSAIPSTLIVDADGRIAGRVLGEVTASTLVGLVTDVAGGR